MGMGMRAALAALVWTAGVGVGLVACGGGGGGGSSEAATGATVMPPAPPAPDSPASDTRGSTGTTGTAGAGASAAGGDAEDGDSTGGVGSGGTGAGAAPPASSPAPPSASAPTLGNCELFPPQAVFNTRIDDTARFPVHPNSAAWIAAIGPATPFRADWWRYEDPSARDAYYGMPVNVVDGGAATTDWAHVLYDFAPSGASTQAGWPHESDCAVAEGAGGYAIARNCSAVPAAQRRFPFPKQGLKNEGGTCNDPDTCGDHHVLVVEQGACRLWESYAAYRLSGQWYMLASAAWDLKSMALRPDTWTAADAAGLPITPFLAKAAEASSGEIRHALRVTFRDAVLARSHTWPARHGAGGDTPGGVPFGSVLRLKADFPIPANWSPQARAIATAAKRYGLYVADIGMDFYVQGEPSVQWDADLFNQLRAIPLSAMEFVDLGSITRDPRFDRNSMQAQW